jgi:hypothetical protein
MVVIKLGKTRQTVLMHIESISVLVGSVRAVKRAAPDLRMIEQKQWIGVDSRRAFVFAPHAHTSQIQFKSSQTCGLWIPPCATDWPTSCFTLNFSVALRKPTYKKWFFKFLKGGACKLPILQRWFSTKLNYKFLTTCEFYTYFLELINSVNFLLDDY